MPKEGEPTRGIDVAGGLESTPGVTKNGRPVRNYRPRWVETLVQFRIPGVQDKDMKFYRTP